jgi:hypothetical protein
MKLFLRSTICIVVFTPTQVLAKARSSVLDRSPIKSSGLEKSPALLENSRLVYIGCTNDITCNNYDRYSF